METQELYRGRLIDHVQIVSKNLARSEQFYTAVFNVLGVPIGGRGEGFFWADEFCISSQDSPAAQGHLTGRIHIAFQAKDEDMVKAFYTAGLNAGGTDNGEPSMRPYHPNYYAAFLLDPDGNNVEAVYHGEGARSQAAVKITF